MAGRRKAKKKGLMAELDRRLRRAVSPGRGDSGEPGARTPAEEKTGVKPVPDGSAAARLGTDSKPEPAWPADTRDGGEPETEQIPSGDSASQFDPGEVDKLPSIEELTQRLPPEVRAALDELFRAKWTGVKRLRPEDLRS